MAKDDWISTPPKYRDNGVYATPSILLSLWELEFHFSDLLKILKQFNECANISKSSSSYDISTRGGCIRTFISRLEKDGYLYEANLFKKLIGKNNRFYTSPKRLIHLLDRIQFNKLKELIESDYFKSTFVFKRKDNVSYLDLYILRGENNE